MNSPFWQKPAVAIGTVVAVVLITGGVAYAATGGGSWTGSTSTSQFQRGQFTGGQFPGFSR